MSCVVAPIWWSACAGLRSKDLPTLALPRPPTPHTQVACELELWAEAFRSVEDIQALISLGKKQPKQQMMATYYAR